MIESEKCRVITRNKQERERQNEWKGPAQTTRKSNNGGAFYEPRC